MSAFHVVAPVRKKLVIVGDGACGKTSLLMYRNPPPTPLLLPLQPRFLSQHRLLTGDRVFQRGECPRNHIPTLFDTFVQDIFLPPNNTHVELALWDTAGQEDFDRLRSLCYPDSDVILICYSIDNRDSLENVVEKWYPDVVHYTGHLKVPFLLVGTKRDLRMTGAAEVRYEEGEAVARRIGARGYVECSALTKDRVNDVFQVATRLACEKRKKSGRSCLVL
jgi:Ras homolog gene family, member A